MKTRTHIYRCRVISASILSFTVGFVMACYFIVRPIEKERSELNDRIKQVDTILYQATVLYEVIDNQYRVLQEIEKGESE